MDEKEYEELKKISLAVSNSLTTRLLEKRFLSLANAPEALLVFAEQFLAHGTKVNPRGYPGLKMAGDIAGRLIEAGRLSKRDAVLRTVEDILLVLDSIADTLPQRHKREILKISSDMVLKMLETITLSGTSIPGTLEKTAETARLFLEKKLEKKPGKDSGEKHEEKSEGLSPPDEGGR